MLISQLRIGDTVTNSQMGAGKIEAISEAGYPVVNGQPVAWLVLASGDCFDPHHRAPEESRGDGGAPAGCERIH